MVAFRRGHFVKNAKLILHMKKETETKIKLSDLKLNDGSYGLPKNPRFIRDERFKKLCDSLRDFPEAMPARGIVVDERGVILGGNMRWRACRELGMAEIPASWVCCLTNLTVEQKRRFIIMDNRPFGDDDTDALANEWNIAELLDAGFDEVDLTGIPIEDMSQNSIGPSNRFMSNSGKVFVCFGEFVGRVEKTLVEQAILILQNMGSTPDEACVALCEKLKNESKP